MYCYKIADSIITPHTTIFTICISSAYFNTSKLENFTKLKFGNKIQIIIIFLINGLISESIGTLK